MGSGDDQLVSTILGKLTLIAVDYYLRMGIMGPVYKIEGV